MKKWWGIRHIRWWFLHRSVCAWCAAWGALCMSKSDEEYLEAVWRGEK